jgi:hypothetical protein
MAEAAKSARRPISKFLVALILLSVLGAFGFSTFALRGATASPLPRFVWALSFAVILTGWVREDRLARGYTVPFEFDAFVLFAWPVMMPYYLVQTRGWRGLYVAAGLFGLFAAPLTIGAFLMAWMALR